MTQDKEDKTINNNKISCLYNLCCGVSAIFIVYINDIFHCLCYGQHFFTCHSSSLSESTNSKRTQNSKTQKLKNLERK